MASKKEKSVDIQCFEFDDYQTYESKSSTKALQNLTIHGNQNKKIKCFSICLEDKDIKTLQAFIPHNSSDFIRTLKSHKKKINPILDIANVFNVKKNFKVDPFNVFETSFKTNFSFVIGMIMTVIYAQKRLKLNELYHYNFKVRNVNGGRKPDFIGYSQNHVKYLLEAKGTMGKKVKNQSIERAMDQLCQNNAIKPSNSFAVATSFNDIYDPLQGSKAFLSIIDPKFKVDFDPYDCIHNLYSEINEKEFDEFERKNNTNFRSKDFLIEDQHVRVSLYVPFFEIERKKYKDLDKKKQNIKRAFHDFQNFIKEDYSQKKGKYTTLFYNGMKIVY